ncbi:MAG TPA: c-type cytochrome [Chitinophagales bacterium]|nr:c-type cytochrome [Chitinophagales bacterium]HRK27975.1 c-type cytochrome [Chitinophagales bacterium]
MKKIASFLLIAALIGMAVACGGGGNNTGNTTDGAKPAPQSMVKDVAAYDPKRGEGKFNPENVVLAEKLDEAMATSGEKISGTKCLSCHKLTEERLVGPGWKGVTQRRQPAWLMNFITNPDPMIDKDPEVQAQLELCLVRMPNQNLTDDDARHVVEFMRKNDGVK